MINTLMYAIPLLCLFIIRVIFQTCFMDYENEQSYRLNNLHKLDQVLYPYASNLWMSLLVNDQLNGGLAYG